MVNSMLSSQTGSECLAQCMFLFLMLIEFQRRKIANSDEKGFLFFLLRKTPLFKRKSLFLDK